MQCLSIFPSTKTLSPPSLLHIVTWCLNSEVCNQKSIVETSVARQRLAATRFRRKEYSCINQLVAQRLSHVSRQQRITQDNQLSDLVIYIRSSWKYFSQFKQPERESSRG
jgi:hypothetical protein